MKIFSFCIYGDNIKYYYGLMENLELINKFYPDYHIYIYRGINYNKDLLDKATTGYKNVEIIDTGIDGSLNMIMRYKPLLLDDLEVFFSRDTDSIINERDRWCINKFIESEYSYHTIRDHYWHKSKLTGGLTGFKKIGNNLDKIKEAINKVFYSLLEQNNKYGIDEVLLNQNIYDLTKDNLLIHTNINAFIDEKYQNIDYLNDNTNFCGNVIEYISETDKFFKFKYRDFNIRDQLSFLLNNKQYGLILNVINDIYIKTYDPSIQIFIYDSKFIAHYYRGELELCMDSLKNFYNLEIPDHVKNNSNFLYLLAKSKGYKIIGTADISYEPKNNEIVIYYGNYADDYLALPQSNKIYKNVLFFNQVKHDLYLSDTCWDKLDKIYIMGLENGHERYYDTLIQLTLMNAPLDKIHHYIAKKDNNLKDIYIGATKNHLDCIKLMIDSQYETCLFLEDDFIFTNNYKKNKESLITFFNRNYNYDICFLSASKYFRRDDFDDLLILSKQICTTSSGYFLHRNTVNKVYSVIKEGYDKLVETGNSTAYCIDRYWCKLCQENTVFIFKDKLGFQKPSVSKITGKLNLALD